MMELNNLNNKTPITLEEGYELVKFYVHFFWSTKKFYSLEGEMEEEDVLHDIYCKFLERNDFARYNPEVTSKKYYIMNSVRTKMIDMLRKHRDMLSLDRENEEGSTLSDIIEDEKTNVEKESISSVRRMEILKQLPDTTPSKISGFSPLFKREVNISPRMLALHLEAGYKAKDLAEFYKNPVTGDSISEGSISRHIRELREFVLDSVRLD